MYENLNRHIVVHTYGRSGSWLFREIVVSSNPNIITYVNDKDIYEGFAIGHMLEWDKDPEKVFSALDLAEKQSKKLMFKTHTADAYRVITPELTRNYNLKHVFLFRKNITEQTLSLLIAQKRNVWCAFEGDEDEPITIDFTYNDIKRVIEDVIAINLRLLAYLRTMIGRCDILFYEDLVQMEHKYDGFDKRVKHNYDPEWYKRAYTDVRALVSKNAINGLNLIAEGYVTFTR